MQLNQVIISASNINNSVAFYKTIGFQLIVLTDIYARFIIPGNQATFSLHHTENVAPSETMLYFECEDVDGTFDQLKNKGIEFIMPPTNQPWLWREAYFNDPDGNKLCIYHAGENRLNPPWRIKE
ncbi:MAG: VOC family protein [Bacteroidota bacterium]